MAVSGKVIRSYRYDDLKSRADVHGYAKYVRWCKKESKGELKSRKRCTGLGTIGVKENVRRAEGEAPLLERRKKPRYFRPPGAATLWLDKSTIRAVEIGIIALSVLPFLSLSLFLALSLFLSVFHKPEGRLMKVLYHHHSCLL